MSAPSTRFGPVTGWLLFFLGIRIMSVGVAISVHAGLGTSPISTLPTALSFATGLTLGELTIVMNIVFVLLQILLLRRRFRPFSLLQIVVAVFFGLMCDVSLALTDGLDPSSYPQQWVLVVVGIVILALGVYLQVLPRRLYVPGEGIVAAITLVTERRFGTLKQGFDWTLVLLAAAASLWLLGELVGVREGTVFAASATGGLVKVFQRLDARFVEGRIGRRAAAR